MIVLLLSLIACSDCDSPAVDCNYLLQDPNADGMQCVSTRPYFSFGSIFMNAAEGYATVDLVIASAPEGDVSMPEVVVNVETNDSAILGDISVELPDGTTHEGGIKSYSDGRLATFFSTLGENIPEAGHTYTLVIDAADAAPDTSVLFSFEDDQTWSSEYDEERTSTFDFSGRAGVTFP